MHEKIFKRVQPYIINIPSTSLVNQVNYFTHFPHKKKGAPDGKKSHRRNRIHSGYLRIAQDKKRCL